MKLRKGDQVLVTVGKDKGQKGKIEKIFPKTGQVLIPKINLFIRHLKSRGEKQPGGRVEIVKPLAVSKIALICPKCGQPTRIGYRFSGEKKERICRKCQAVV